MLLVHFHSFYFLPGAFFQLFLFLCVCVLQILPYFFQDPPALILKGEKGGTRKRKREDKDREKGEREAKSKKRKYRRERRGEKKRERRDKDKG